MRMHGPGSILVLVMALVLLVCSATSAVAENSMERIEYWKKYPELQSTDDPCVTKVRDIFQRILHAAGKSSRTEAKFFLMQGDPKEHISLPIALPDGWIVLSKAVLDRCSQELAHRCSQEPEQGDNRLAFVLAHEISHQLNDDFWQVKFFQAIEASRGPNPQHNKILQEVQARLQSSEDIWTKELQADERGIFYAAMAGFDTQAIVSQDHTVNFFQDWVDALNLKRISVPSQPTPSQRAEAVKARLSAIVNQMPVFQVGFWSYQAGKYQQAIFAFDNFRQVFQSREVYHNLASAHHQFALQAYQVWKKDEQAFPYRLSLAIDPVTRANQIALTGRRRAGQLADPDKLFREHLSGLQKVLS